MSWRLESLVGLWQAAEDRLHPMVLAQPEAYERHLLLVRMVADELRSARTPGQLAEAYGNGPQTVEAVIEREGIAAEEMNLGVVAGAAFSIRYREVLAEARREEALRRVREARERGETWVVVDERGRPDPPTLAYRRLEMHLPEGTGLDVFIEPDPDTDRASYGLEAIPLDPRTGDRVAQASPLTELRTFSDRGRWEEAVEELHRRYGAMPP